jgi:predicted transcriptional regulator
MLVSYFAQLERATKKAEISLLAAYVRAGLPTSTYYRHVQGTADPRLETATSVFDCIVREFEERHGVAFDHAA